MGKRVVVDPVRYQRIKDILYELSGLEPGARMDHINAMCQGEETLRDEVLALADVIDNPTLPLAVGQLTSLEPLTQVGAFEIVRVIGEGGMGRVYEARRILEGVTQRVALKMILSGRTSPEFEARFKLERQILASLQHPNIASLIDGGVHEGNPYLVMEYVNGVAITEYCQRERLTLRKRLELFQELCSAVAYAHSCLLIHRDLKPGNILVDDQGRVKLLDFGIAKVVGDSLLGQQLTHSLTERTLGPLTPRYAAPEQLKGQPVSTATDVYGLGLILYELLSGEQAQVVDSDSVIALYRMILEDSLSKPSQKVKDSTQGHSSSLSVSGVRDLDQWCNALKGDLDAIVLYALRKEPERRYKTVAAFADDISAFLAHKPVQARGDSIWYVATKFIVRHKAAVTFASVAFLALVWVAVQSVRFAWVTAKKNEEVRAERDRAQAVTQFLFESFSSVDPSVYSVADQSARLLLAQSAQRVRTEFVDDPQLRSAVMSLLGHLYREFGDMDTAETLLRDAMASDQLAALERARIQANLAPVVISRGDYEQGERLFEEAITTMEQYDNRLYLAEAYLGRSGYYLERRNYENCREDLAKVAPLAAGSDVESLRLRQSYVNSMGQLLNEMQNPHEAVRYVRESVDLCRQLYGDGALRTANAEVTLALTLIHLEQLEESLTLMNEAVKKAGAVLDRSHPLMQAFLNQYAWIAELNGDMDQALALGEEVLEIRREHLGSDHPLTLVSITNLAFSYDSLERYEEAEKLYLEAAAISERILSDSSAERGVLYNNLCYHYRSRGLFEQAIEFGKRSVEVHARDPLQETYFGQSCSLLASVYIDKGEYDNAMPYIDQALEIAQKLDAPQVLSWGRLALKKAEVLNQQGETAQARIWIERSEPLLRAHESPDSVQLVRLESLKKLMGGRSD